MNQTYWQQIDHIIGPETVNDFENIGQKPIREALEGFILQNSNESTKLFDAGCNTGVEGYRLFQQGFSGLYVGADSNAGALSIALENLKGSNAAFMLTDCECVASPDQYFDIVLTKDVIEHAEYYENILADLARLANKWLILSMFIKMHDEPDYIHREPAGFYHNRYQRSKLYDFVCLKGFKEPELLFQSGEDELLIFERIASK